MSRPMKLVWAEGAKQLNKGIPEGPEKGQLGVHPHQPTNLVTLSLYIKICMFRQPDEPDRTAGVGRGR
jgi:hypothetical protein